MLHAAKINTHVIQSDTNEYMNHDLYQYLTIKLSNQTSLSDAAGWLSLLFVRIRIRIRILILLPGDGSSSGQLVPPQGGFYLGQPCLPKFFSNFSKFFSKYWIFEQRFRPKASVQLKKKDFTLNVLSGWASFGNGNIRLKFFYVQK